MKASLLFVWCVLLMLPTVVLAQRPESQVVEVRADDGLTLVGDYYQPVEPSDGSPAILLLHQHGGDRLFGAFLAQPLIEQGYALLAVDLRGHGDTGGDEDWEAVTRDVQIWMDWLQSQPGIQPDGVSTIGVGVGGNYALIACGNDEECKTAIAVTPLASGCDVVSCAEEVTATSVDVIDYIDASTTDAMSEGLRRRSALIIASQQFAATDSAKHLISISQGEVQAIFFDGGTSMLEFFTFSTRIRVMELIIDWLNQH